MTTIISKKRISSASQALELQLKSVIEQETDALIQLRENIDDAWSQAVLAIANCKSKIIVSGVGKSGDIGKKIAASFTSTGTPAIFICPTEASHGALGLLENQDILIVLSASGKTSELLEMIRYAKQQQIFIITITKNLSSPLSKLADVTLQIPNVAEACINGLAPTTSTTCQLVTGDALVVAVMSLRNFTAEDFKKFHPGGNLGRLLLPVKDFMYKGQQIPLVNLEASIKEGIVEMNAKSLGCVGIVNNRQQYVGIFTDGDLRRCLETSAGLEEPIAQYMTPSPLTIAPDMLTSELAEFFEQTAVPNVFVVENSIPIGIVHIRQLNSSL